MYEDSKRVILRTVDRIDVVGGGCRWWIGGIVCGIRAVVIFRGFVCDLVDSSGGR